MDQVELLRELSAFLEPDGSWRDVVVPQTSRADWLAVLHAIHDANVPYECGTGEDRVSDARLLADLPALQMFDGISASMLYSNGRLDAKTHFFVEDEIEFDIDPVYFRRNPDLFGDLLNFMRLIGDATSKHCHLTHENRHEWIGLTWNPIERSFTLGPYAKGWPHAT